MVRPNTGHSASRMNESKLHANYDPATPREVNVVFVFVFPMMIEMNLVGIIEELFIYFDFLVFWFRLPG